MGDGSSVVTTGNQQVKIRQVKVTEDTLREVARALGITGAAEQREFIEGVESIHIFRGSRPGP